jgi:hypothetical protein
MIRGFPGAGPTNGQTRNAAGPAGPHLVLSWRTPVASQRCVYLEEPDCPRLVKYPIKVATAGRAAR